MIEEEAELRRSLPTAIKIWFAFDFIVCCFPPIYLAFSGRGPLPNLPLSVGYFLFAGLFVTLSILAAYRMSA
ncbi:hypothetical protein AiwAL_07605 [Acidiphilium sp. AL]|uniref:Uncharacterized protein n=1 Tax=Acidiphilium iwatense TaxID=768198 RepID=A0ABS9DXW0_9PROT|nr:MULTISPECIES: hypothetical protein [Acidiphilium]MCF3946645.1 hypothetical protein [Acidiphilium iwatense]MCU4159970.1 hypothetical protein [Acidiphilium sp. AL]